MVFAIIGWVGCLLLGAKLVFDGARGAWNQGRAGSKNIGFEILLLAVGGAILGACIAWVPFRVAVEFVA